MRRDDCELCDKSILDYPILRESHIFFDFVFMCLFLMKMLLCMFWLSLTLGKIKNFPCECSHKALWHLSMFKNHPFPKDNINWIYMLFCFKFERDEKIPLSECLYCLIAMHKPYNERCEEFKPLNNLTYLENLYNKK